MTGFIDYPVEILPCRSPANDRITAFLIPRIDPPWLDIGCNAGWLLHAVPGGTGIDASLVAKAASQWPELSRGRQAPVLFARAEALPFQPRAFQTVVLSCVLEQIPPAATHLVLGEALRVCRDGGKVIGVNPLPGSPWGTLGGWVQAILPEALIHEMRGTTHQMDTERYYFEVGR